VASHIELLKKIESKKRYFPQSNLNEDVFFSFLFDKYGYNLPTKELADSIFQELSAVSQTQIPNVVGFHGLDRLNPELEKKIFLLHGVE
jgi:hypothetical protein